MAKKVFLICPVREMTEDEKNDLEKYVVDLESDGIIVHWPFRDTKQTDPLKGVNIVKDNIKAIKKCDEVHIWWKPESSGSKFDLGATLALNKPIVLANEVVPNDSLPKSFEHVLVALAENSKKEVNYG
jgi:nucleoside 2-deoxyribosyltransferase